MTSCLGGVPGVPLGVSNRQNLCVIDALHCTTRERPPRPNIYPPTLRPLRLCGESPSSCTVSHIMMTSLRSKWAAGKARGGRISKSIRNRRATQPPAHFQRNPPGRGQLAVFPRCSLLTYQSRYARRSRLEKQPTDMRRNPRDLGDGTLAASVACSAFGNCSG